MPCNRKPPRVTVKMFARMVQDGRPLMNGANVKVYMCFEPDQRLCAEKIDSWPRTNSDLDDYDRRLRTPVDGPDARLVQDVLRRQIHNADVTICIIAGPTYLNPWIAWELETAKASPRRMGLVGVLLKDYVEPPLPLRNCGAIFVPFKRDALERAVQWALEGERANEDYTLSDD
jgi:hypothetical protein